MIELKQVPVIEHTLKEIGESVRKRISELNLENQVATEESVKFLKETRAELNKEFLNYENDRKELKKTYMSPYDEFDLLYKQEIANEFTKADELLKSKVASVELRIKEDKKIEVETYFKELCLSEGIEFVSFEQTGIKIDLSTSLKKLKEQANDFVYKVKDDLNLINSLPDAIEILVEYKKGLNASKSITEIQDRKKRLQEEKERKYLEVCRQRQSLLRSMCFVYREAAQVFEYNESIFVTKKQLAEETEENFKSIISDFKEKIEALKTLVETVKAPESIQQPVIEKKEVTEQKLQLLTSSFEVMGTLQQIKDLAEYMRNNNIKFKTI